MASTQHWTSADLEIFPDDDGKRYEIIAGKLFVSKQPHFYHQDLCGKIYSLLENWSSVTQLGKAVVAPGLIFAADDDVVPDVAWLSHQRLATALEDDGKLHSAPDLIVEVLSPGSRNKRRDREAKLKLYSRRVSLNIWIVDWSAHAIEIYRQQDAELVLVATKVRGDLLESNLLPGFSAQVDALFAGLS